MAIEKPVGNPANWSRSEWGRYHAWEAAQAQPPPFGPYQDAEGFYSSREWLKIVRRTAQGHKVSLGVARRIGDATAIAAIEKQLGACAQELARGAGEPGLFA